MNAEAADCRKDERTPAAETDVDQDQLRARALTHPRTMDTSHTGELGSTSSAKRAIGVLRGAAARPWPWGAQPRSRRQADFGQRRYNAHPVSRALKRWLSVLLLGALAFSQASLVLAACGIDRAALVQALAGDMHDCCDSERPAPNLVPMSANSCLGEGTSDLQASGTSIPAVAAPPAQPVLFVSQPHGGPTPSAVLRTPPARAVPSRILLHSFLI